MSDGPRGVYKVRNGWGNQNSVRVDFGTSQLDMSEDDYRERHYEPSADDLPWQDDYERSNA